MLLADTGIPMLFWQLPLAVAAFVPIVAVEALIAWRIVAQPLWPVTVRVAAANAASTFVGIPIAWVFMFVLELSSGGSGGFTRYDTPWQAFRTIVCGAAWLAPDEAQWRWLVPAATLVLLVPYFFVSVVVERWVLQRYWRDLARPRVALAAWAGNAVTYCGLALWAWYQLHSAVHGRRSGAG